MKSQQQNENALTCQIAPKLLLRARKLTSNASDAEDLTQETLLRLLQTSRNTDLQSPESYAMIVLHNLARRRWKANAQMNQLDAPETLSAPPNASAKLACAQIINAINKLPREQAILMHHVVQGETSPQCLAQKTGCPEGTVNSRLARARKTLRQHAGIGPHEKVAELL